MENAKPRFVIVQGDDEQKVQDDVNKALQRGLQVVFTEAFNTKKNGVDCIMHVVHLHQGHIKISRVVS